MKKMISLLLMLSLSLGLMAGCGSTAEKGTPAPATPAPAASQPAAPAESEPAAELAFPEKTITITIPWAAGGAVDLFVRQIADSASQIAGVPMVVENNTGAGGTVAATQYLEEASDGYSVLVAATPVVFYQPYVRDVTYSVEDFSPIIGLHKTDLFLVVSAKSGIETLEDFKEAASSSSFTWGSAGAGTIDYVAQSALANALGITPNNVPYEGAVEQITAIVGGNLDATCAVKGSFEEYVKSGDLKVVGCFAENDVELEGIGTVPCMKTLGCDVSCYNSYFLLGKGDTDPAVIDKLYEIFNAALESESVKEYIAAMQYDMNALDPAAMSAYFGELAAQAQELFG